MDPSIHLRDRPDSPWVAAGPGLAWHHMVPYETLRDVWNRLVKEHITTQSPVAKTTVNRYLLLLDPTLRTDPHVKLNEWITRIYAENPKARAVHNALEPLDHAEVNRLRQAAAWPAWDLVAGWTPDRRSDEPRKGTVFEHFTVGLKAGEESRMKALGRFHCELQDCVRAPGEEFFRAVNQAITNVSGWVKGCDKPIHYRPEMWVRDDENGSISYRKRYKYEMHRPGPLPPLADAVESHDVLKKISEQPNKEGTYSGRILCTIDGVTYQKISERQFIAHPQSEKPAPDLLPGRFYDIKYSEGKVVRCKINERRERREQEQGASKGNER